MIKIHVRSQKLLFYDSEMKLDVCDAVVFSYMKKQEAAFQQNRRIFNSWTLNF